MERTFGDAITIGDIAAHDRAQSHKIEIRVLQFEWIKRPFDEPDATPQSVLALEKFQAAADAAILKFRNNGGHVRVQELLPRPHACQGHGEADQARSVESAENLSARVVRDHEDWSWNGDGLSPSVEFQANAFFVLRERVAVADFDFRRRRVFSHD